jgi:uncharacterized protein (TIGR02265 family)
MPFEFVVPDRDAPLDVASHIEAMPRGAAVKGMYATAVVEAARARGFEPPSARERYLAFQDVPLPEYATLLVETARAFFPSASLRSGLRKLGRSGHDGFARSVVGRVVFSTADALPGALAATAKAYCISMPPARAEVRVMESHRAVLSFAGVYNFLDCHHVGVLEGVTQSCGVRVQARVRLESLHAGDIELTW